MALRKSSKRVARARAASSDAVSDATGEHAMSSSEEARMTLMEHLTELRNRILVCIGAVGFAAIVGFILYPQIMSWLSGPLHDATKNLSQCKIARCDKLITTDYLSPFLVRLKIATYFGILASSPIVLWNVWRFITPGLTSKERKYAVPFVASSVALFGAGTVVAWFTLSKALQFLIAIGGDKIDVKSTANSYITLVGLMFLGFGISFQFPILLVFLLLVGAVTTATLRKYRRHSIVGIVIFAAVITPSQDPYSLFLMAIPMWIFFEISIVIGRVLKR